MFSYKNLCFPTAMAMYGHATTHGHSHGRPPAMLDFKVLIFYSVVGPGTAVKSPWCWLTAERTANADAVCDVP